MNNIKKNWDIYLFSILTLGLFLFWYVLFARDPNGSQSNVFFSNATDWFMDYFNTVYMTVGKSASPITTPKTLPLRLARREYITYFDTISLFEKPSALNMPICPRCSSSCWEAACFRHRTSSTTGSS